MKKSKLLATLLLCAAVSFPVFADTIPSVDVAEGVTYTTSEELNPTDVIETATNRGTFNNENEITTAINEETGVFNNKTGGSITTELTNSGTFNNEGGSIAGTVTNNKTLNNNSGTISAAINNVAGATLTSNASNITGTVKNSGTYNVTGGTIASAITEYSGSAGILNLGSDSTAVTVTNSVDVTQNQVNVLSQTTLNNTGNITGTLTNNNVVNNNAGVISNVINKNNAKFANNGGKVGDLTNEYGSEFTSAAGDITGTIKNSGKLNLTSGDIATDITEVSGSTGELNLGSDSAAVTMENTAAITQKNINVLGSTTLNNSGNITGTLTNNNVVNNNAGVISNVINKNTAKFTNNGGKVGNLTNENGSEFTSAAGDITGTIKNSGKLNLTSGNITKAITEYSGSTGELNLGSDTAAVTMNSNASITQKEINILSKTTLNNNAKINGSVKNTGNLVSNANNINGTVDNTGNYTITGGTISKAITGNGTLNVGNGTAVAEVINNATIEQDTVNINDKAVFETKNTIDATTITNDGKFIINATTVTADDFTNNNHLTIKNHATLDAANWVSSADSILEVDNSEFNMSGSATQSAGTYIITGADNDNRGVINLDGATIYPETNLQLEEFGNLTLDNESIVNFDGDTEDKWAGRIYNDGDSLIIADSNFKSEKTAGLIQTSGATVVNDNSDVYIGDSESSVTNGSLNVTNNSKLTFKDSSQIETDSSDELSLNIDSNSSFNSGSNGFKIDTLNSTGVVNAINGGIESYSISNIDNFTSSDIAGEDVSEAPESRTSNFAVDLHARAISTKNYSSDTIVDIDSVSNLDNLNISETKLNGDIYGWDAPIERHYTMSIFKDVNGDPFTDGTVQLTSTADDVFTPIGWYRLNNFSGQNGNYTFDLMKYNPQVFRGQVTTLAQYQNQLSINDMLFTHSMVLPSFKEEDGGVNASIMANRYAGNSPVFAPYQYSRKNGGLWYKMYGQFETLQMDQGLSNVTNNSYGALIGADFGLKELRNNWKFMPSAYIGYNGAHQAFNKVSAFQNGGQLGFLGTFYRDNFILGTLLFGGMYDNSMDVGGTNGAVYSASDNTFNYFAGAAVKPAYNIRLHRDWVLQPNLYAGYTFFGQQNWHSTFGQMGMMSGVLNGVNIAPGMNLIWEKETFSTYLTLQYMYNIAQHSSGRAGNVKLPNVNMERGYIQYGIGFTKKFTDRCSGYFQAVLRNVGRTGGGFQVGFNYLLGK